MKTKMWKGLFFFKEMKPIKKNKHEKYQFSKNVIKQLKLIQ